MAGRLGHIELPAQDDERGKRFWGSLFGWEFQDAGIPEMRYHLTQIGDVGGAVFASENAGSGPIVYFTSDDIDSDVARVRELGGQGDDKQPIPGIGWFARCHDTEGNPFSLFEGDESVPHPES